METLRKPISLVWLILMTATCVSTWWLTTDEFLPAAAMVITFVIAATKVRLVILYFMELRHAPWPWRLFFEAWVVVVPTVILVIYFYPMS